MAFGLGEFAEFDTTSPASSTSVATIDANVDILLNSNPIDIATRTAQDITSEIEITDSAPLNIVVAGMYRVVISTNSTITATATLTLRVVYNDGSNDFEVYNDDVTVSNNAIRVSKTSNSFYADAVTSTVKAYITSDNVGDSSVNVEARLIQGGA